MDSVEIDASEASDANPRDWRSDARFRVQGRTMSITEGGALDAQPRWHREIARSDVQWSAPKIVESTDGATPRAPADRRDHTDPQDTAYPTALGSPQPPQPP